MNEKKDIVFLCQFFYPEYVSSATLPFDTAKKLAEQSFMVGALCGYPYEYCDQSVPMRETVNNIEIKRLKYLKLKRTSKIGRLINYFSFIFKAFLSLRHLKNYKTVVVYSNPPLLPWIAERAKKKYGCKIIFVAYDIYPEIALRTDSISEDGAICKLIKKINTSFFGSVDRVVALSEEMKQYIVENRPVDADKMVVIPNWYKDDGEKSPKISEDSRFSKLFSSKKVISYLGNMGTCQDIDTVLETAKLLRDKKEYVFLFAGHGNKTDVVKAAIENGAPNILYYDFLHGQDYLDVLNLTSYAVISLTGNLCGLCVPSKSYAYMMRNLPLIAIMDKKTDIAKDIIESQSGIVVGNGEAQKIAEYLLSGEDSAQIREVYLKKYTPEVTLDKYVGLLNDLMRGNADE